jgi:non-heme chloroperoxidase
MGDFVTGDGVRLHFEEKGAGRPLLLMPAWGASSRWFGAQLDGLSDRLRVIALDPRFHGESDRPEHGSRVSRTAQDVHELLDALDLDDVVLLGWSISVATLFSYFDLFGSHRIGRFVIVCGSPKPLNDEGWNKGFTEIGEAVAFKAFAAADPLALAKTNVPTYFVSPRSESDLEWMIADTASLPPSAAGVAFDCIVQDYRDLVPRLDRPTLAIYSERDPIVPGANIEFFASALPSARRELFRASGHCPPLEEADRFNRVVGEFATEGAAGSTAQTGSSS